MTKLTVLGPEDKLAEIRRLYFAATKQTINDDLAKAVQLLKSMHTEDERERATVYMDGLAQMRSDWAREGRRGGASPPNAGPKSHRKDAPSAAGPPNRKKAGPRGPRR